MAKIYFYGPNDDEREDETVEPEETDEDVIAECLHDIV